MKIALKRSCIFVLTFIVFSGAVIRAQNLDAIGVTLLRAVTTNLNGAGIRVAQPEAGLDYTNNPPMIWEVNPAATGQPTNLFTYFSSNSSSSNYPNSLGTESGHADAVGGIFYGTSGGVATNVAHVDNFEASYFYNDIIAATLPSNIGDPVVNQSFTFGSVSSNEQETIDSAYDNYAVQYSTLFVSAANNGGSVSPPGTSYNCISVGDYANGTYYNSIGPTIDNGRCKPDITAPGTLPDTTVTSFTTPQVAGAAAVLMQAGLRGDGGSDTNSAADIRTIKSLLLNGAIKPNDWTNIAPSPLDFRYGAGVLNVFNSYEQLAGGKHAYIVSTTISSGSAHPPTGATGTINVLSAWDFNTNTSSTFDDAVNHYFFDVTNNLSSANFTATATLLWNRQQNQTGINNLDLFLYNCANSNLVACSTSLVDNVQHIFLPKLAQGRYDLQVWKAAGTPGISIVSSSEAYALAWEFFSPMLNITNTGANLALTFPVYPAGFLAESTTNLSPPINWNTNLPSPVFTNNQNYISLNATNSAQFFRLHRP